MKWWYIAAAIIATAAAVFVWLSLAAIDAMRQPAITQEDMESAKQSAYYQGWQDGKQHYLDEFGGNLNG